MVVCSMKGASLEPPAGHLPLFHLRKTADVGRRIGRGIGQTAGNAAWHAAALAAYRGGLRGDAELP